MSDETVGNLKTMAAASRTAQDVRNSDEQQKRDEAWQYYAGYGEYYQQRRAEQAKTAKVDVVKFGGDKVTLIASININKDTGEAISGHDYDPESQSMKDIESAWQDFLATTQPEERLVVFEGSKVSADEIPNRDIAIRNRTESGLVQYLAAQARVETTGGEPTNMEVADQLEQQGVPRLETALLFTIRSLSMHHSEQPIGDIKFHFLPQMRWLGYEGFEDYSQVEKDSFKQDGNGNFVDNSPEAEAIRVRIDSDVLSKVEPFTSDWNKMLTRYGLPQLEVANGGLSFEHAISQDELADKADPAKDGELSHMFARIVAIRDRHIFDVIADATRKGKKVFAPYGGSHEVSLEPVLQDYFGSMESSLQIQTR